MERLVALHSSPIQMLHGDLVVHFLGKPDPISRALFSSPWVGEDRRKEAEDHYKVFEMSEQIHCQEGYHQESPNEPLIAAEHSCSKCSQKYFQPEVCSISSEVSPGYIECRNCGIVDYTRRPFLSGLGSIFTIVMARWRQVGNTRVKDNFAVKFGCQLTLDPFCKGMDNQNFELVSVIEHSGTLNQGHYVSYQKLEKNWYRFDDEK
jgi:hypothetical protein